MANKTKVSVFRPQQVGGGVSVTQIGQALRDNGHGYTSMGVSLNPVAEAEAKNSEASDLFASLSTRMDIASARASPVDTFIPKAMADKPLVRVAKAGRRAGL